MNELIKDNVKVLDINLLINKELYDENGFNYRYYILYKNYKRLLDNYLLNKLSLKKYDDMFDKSGIIFMPVKKEDMDFYQFISTMNLKYIYLRNNLYVEKLSPEDINTLINLEEAELSKPDNNLNGLLERTYKTIIDSRNGNQNASMVRFGPDSDAYWFKSDELVFGIRHDDFGNNGLDDEKWEDNYYKQSVFINNLIAELSKKCSDILGIKTNFVWYDEYSAEIKKTIK